MASPDAPRPPSRRRRIVIGLVKFLLPIIVVVLVAVGIVWFTGALGPVTTEHQTDQGAQTECQNMAAALFGNPNPTFDNVVVGRNITGWTVSGSIKATNPHGITMRRDFQCTAEAVRGTWGVSLVWTSNARPIPRP